MRANPVRPCIVWVEEDRVVRWTPEHGTELEAERTSLVRDIRHDDLGNLWGLDGEGVFGPETWSVAADRLDIDGNVVRAVRVNWEDGIGPVTTWFSRDGTSVVQPGLPVEAAPMPLGTPDGRILVAVRSGLYGIWELER